MTPLLEEHDYRHETIDDVREALDPIKCELDRQRKYTLILAIVVALTLLCIVGIGIRNWIKSDDTAQDQNRTAAKAEVTKKKADRTLEYLRGERGIPGVPGKNGVRGAPGQPGQRGARGPVGARGPRGPAGSPGQPGQDGENGQDGEAGAQGTKGEKGERGEKGEQGERGSQGEPGSAGAQGELGPTGFPGPAGPPPAGIQSACAQPDGTVQNQVTTDPDGDGIYTCP